MKPLKFKQVLLPSQKAEVKRFKSKFDNSYPDTIVFLTPLETWQFLCQSDVKCEPLKTQIDMYVDYASTNGFLLELVFRK